MVTKMDTEQLKKIIETNFKKIEEINPQTKGELPESINEVINLLDKVKIRVAEKINNEWIVNQWIKQGILLSFKINEMDNLSGPYSSWYDKAHLLKGKTAGWSKEDHIKAGFRMVPNSPVRKGSFIGKNCHISAGSGVGGVLEPIQANPTIIEDDVFLGAMSEVVEGVIVGTGSVLSMGMYIGQSTKIVNRSTGEITYGKIPPYSVVVPGTLPDKNNASAPSLYCAVIIKQVDEKTRSKTSINDLLRE